MRKPTYRLSRSTEAELLELWAYVLEASQSELRADKVIEQIVQTFSALAEYPRMERSRDEVQAGARSFPVARHVIYYRLVVDGIEISHVLHGAQDISAGYVDELKSEDPA